MFSLAPGKSIRLSLSKPRCTRHLSSTNNNTIPLQRHFSSKINGNLFKRQFAARSFTFQDFRTIIVEFAKRPFGWEHFPPRDGKSNEDHKKGEDEEKKQSDEEKTQKTRSEQEEKDSGSGPTGSGEPDRWKITLTFVISTILLLMLTPSLIAENALVDWHEFVHKYLAQKRVKKLVVDDQYVRVIGKDGREIARFMLGSVEWFEKRLEEAQQSLGFDDSQYVPVIYTNGESAFYNLVKTLPFILLSVGALVMFSRFGLGGAGRMKNMFSVGKSPAKMVKEDKVKVKFQDVAGLPEAKVEIQEFVDFLKTPKKYEALGAKIPKGAMLVGPPGTGKTLLAKATAGEAGVPFYSTSGSDFIEMFVGVGPARVRDLFAQARESAPCIIFIDEIDAIGRARGKSSMGGGNDERENTLNQILVEMDGFTSSTGVVVLAGTNRPDVLDKALTRPGRFDRQIAIGNPDLKSREEIFMVHLKPITLENPDARAEIAKKLAELTPGFSGADIANCCNEAALIAARRQAENVTLKDFEAAIDRVTAGIERKSKVLAPLEKKKTAYHEAGHVVASHFLPFADPILKVSIVPRGKGLGVTQYLPEDKYLLTTEQINDKMSMALGGRVAEEIIFGSITSGAADDLDKVTKMAYSQVSYYGMNKKIGPLSFPREGSSLKPYSEETAEIIDSEVRSLVDLAYQRTKQILTEKKGLLENVAQALLEKEVLSAEDLKIILGEKVRDSMQKGTA